MTNKSLNLATLISVRPRSHQINACLSPDLVEFVSNPVTKLVTLPVVTGTPVVVVGAAVVVVGAMVVVAKSSKRSHMGAVPLHTGLSGSYSFWLDNSRLILC